MEDLLTKLELDCLGDAADKFFATRCDSEEAVIITDDLLNSFFSFTVSFWRQPADDLPLTCIPFQVAALVKEKQISKFGAHLFSECLSRVGDLGSKPALAIYMEGIIRFTKLRPGERKKGPSCLQVNHHSLSIKG